MNKAWNLLLAAGVLALVAVPFLLWRGGEPGTNFTGADDQAEEMVKEIRPDYIPWAEPFWKPPSGDYIETLLFCNPGRRRGFCAGICDWIPAQAGSNGGEV